MFHYINDWHDYVRIADVLVAFACLYLLGVGFRRMQGEANTKTRDLWFAVLLWCITSIALAVEGVYEDRPVEPRLLFYTMAICLTLKVLLNKSSWGGPRQDSVIKPE